MITVERVSRVLNHFNIAFTEQAVLGYLKRGQLDKAALDWKWIYFMSRGIPTPRAVIGAINAGTKYGTKTLLKVSLTPLLIQEV